MPYVQRSLWPRAAAAWLDAVLLQSLPRQLFSLQYPRSASFQAMAGILGSKGMTDAWGDNYEL
jgi:hypothetical protein